MLLAAGREVVSKTSAYNITNLSYRVEVRVIYVRVCVHTMRTHIRRRAKLSLISRTVSNIQIYISLYIYIYIYIYV